MRNLINLSYMILLLAAFILVEPRIYVVAYGVGVGYFSLVFYFKNDNRKAFHPIVDNMIFFVWPFALFVTTLTDIGLKPNESALAFGLFVSAGGLHAAAMKYFRDIREAQALPEGPQK